MSEEDIKHFQGSVVKARTLDDDFRKKTVLSSYQLEGESVASRPDMKSDTSEAEASSVVLYSPNGEELDPEDKPSGGDEEGEAEASGLPRMPVPYNSKYVNHSLQQANYDGEFHRSGTTKKVKYDKPGTIFPGYKHYVWARQHQMWISFQDPKRPSDKLGTSYPVYAWNFVGTS